jgi:hypothetical protein
VDFLVKHPQSVTKIADKWDSTSALVAASSTCCSATMLSRLLSYIKSTSCFLLWLNLFGVSPYSSWLRWWLELSPLRIQEDHLPYSVEKVLKDAKVDKNQINKIVVDSYSSCCSCLYSLMLSLQQCSRLWWTSYSGWFYDTWVASTDDGCGTMLD